MKKSKKFYLKLFLSTFYISAVTFGGGYVIVPLMKRKFADELKWIEEREVLDLTAIAQLSPGAIAVNASILIGYRIAGVIGAVITILGTVLPPLITISVISFFYAAFRENHVISALLKGMQAGVAAVIADVVLGMGHKIVKQKQIISIAIMAAAFTATFIFKINVVFIILTFGVYGALSAIYRQKTEGCKNDIS